MSLMLDQIKEECDAIVCGTKAELDVTVSKNAEELFFEKGNALLSSVLGIFYFFQGKYLLAYSLLKDQNDIISRFYLIYSLWCLGYGENAKALCKQYGAENLFTQEKISNKQRIYLAFLLGLNGGFNLTADETDEISVALLALLKDFHANRTQFSAAIFRTGDNALINEYDRRSQMQPVKPKLVVSEHYFDDEFLKVYSNSTRIGKNMYLLKIQDNCVIIDCGKDTDDSVIDFDRFFRDAGVSKENIKAVFFTHAHRDHIGSSMELLDYLGGDVDYYLTKDTQQIALCGNQVNMSGRRLHCVNYNNSLSLSDNLEVTLIQNGHVLGSMALIFKCQGKNILFTSDFCLHEQYTTERMDLFQIQALVRNRIDYLITETTYGKKMDTIRYEDNARLLQQLVELLNKYNKRVFMPAYAIGRTQEILRILDDNPPCPTINVLGNAYDVTLYYKNLERCNVNIYPGVENTNNCAVIIASSGMLMQGSASYMFMRQILDNPAIQDIALIQTGYMPPGQIGSQLIDEWKASGRLFFNVGLSAHASRTEIHALINHFDVGHIIAIHGDGLV